MTWHQWHHTALIASSTGLSATCASWNAFSPHGRHPISAARFGRGEKRNVNAGPQSFGNLIQLDLVAEGIEDVRSTPSGDGFSVFEARPVRAQRLHRGLEVVHSEGEMPARVKAQLAVGGEMHVAWRRRIPDARAVPERRRSFQLRKPERVSVEHPSARFFPRRIEHLRMMQGNPHKFEFRRAEIRCFSRISWAIIYS